MTEKISWRQIRYYQNKHDEFHQTEEDVILQHQNRSCRICCAHDSAKSPDFLNFWGFVTTYFAAF